MSSSPAVTLADLGRLLDLDKSSVSLALRGSPRIGEETRKRVLEAAQRYGYRINLAARQLQLGARSLSVLGVYLPNNLVSLIGPTAMRTIQTLARLVSERGLLFQLLVAQSAAGEQSALRPDLALLWGDMSLSTANELIQSHARSVVIDPNHPSFAEYSGPTIRLDNAGAGAMLARLLKERGSRRLLFVTVDTRHLGHGERWHGARSEWVRDLSPGSCREFALADLDDARLVEFVKAGVGDGAIMCSNDLGGLQVWRRLQRLGIGMPEQVRLVSFDGEDYARAVGLTTAIFDHERVAQVACEAMFSEAQPITAAAIPFQLHLGDSA